MTDSNSIKVLYTIFVGTFATAIGLYVTVYYFIRPQFSFLNTIEFRNNLDKFVWHRSIPRYIKRRYVYSHLLLFVGASCMFPALFVQHKLGSLIFPTVVGIALLFSVVLSVVRLIRDRSP